jgi:lipopolysaccharide export system protein LptA
VEIYADQGLELVQDSRTVIARVNAKAIRGNVTLTADVIVAHYRDKAETPATSAALRKEGTTPAKAAKKSKEAGAAPAPGGAKDEGTGGSEVWRIEAQGHVVIKTPTQTVTGDYGDYNIDDAVVVVTGTDLRLTTPTDVVTARDSLEYWEGRQQAVARGNALAVRGDDRLRADVLVADFAQGADRKTSIQKAHGYNNVVLTTPTEIVTGDRADYVVESGIVTVTGSVKITRDENQLDGEYAVVNLNTGISRIFPVAPGSPQTSDRRVKGLFVPQKKQSGSAPTPAPDRLPGTP